MFLRNYPSLFVLIYLIFVKSTAVNGIIDPITGTLAIGAFVAGYFMHKSNYDIPLFSKCPKTVDIYDLKQEMDTNFFGQHIASNLILSALKANYHRSSNNKKPLVMSFHGWTGSGKNYVSDLIANHMFRSEKIKKLRYHVFHEREDEILSKSNYFKDKVYSKVYSAIKACETNIFVFDELQYIPSRMLDTLIPILENHDMSIDSRNSIFIFLTNAGSDAIVKKYLELWESGYTREQMNILDFDTVLLKSTFNEIGGLEKSKIIDSHVIDYYIPFLPLEEKHVMQCIDAESRRLNKSLNSQVKRKIMQMVIFGPEPQKLFSTSGCKRINSWVTTESFGFD